MALEAQNNPFTSVLMVEAADPEAIGDADPSAGQRRLVVGTDHLLYLLDDSGVKHAVGGGLTDPMTTRGDIIVRNASNVTARLARGSASQVLTSDGTDVAWATPASAPVYGSAMYKRTAGNYTTTSTSMVSVDGTNMALTITTGARRCLVGFVGDIGNSAAGDFVELDIDIDGTLQGNGSLGMITQNSSGSSAWNNGSFTMLTAVLSAGSHTFTLKWRVNGAGTATMQGSNPPAWFYVMEQGS